MTFPSHSAGPALDKTGPVSPGPVVREKMRIEIKRLITGALFLVAAGVGIFHLKQGLLAIFVFKNNEPISSWILILSGPVSTLPATITGIFNRKVGGWWLIAGSVISLSLFFIITEDKTNLTFFLINVLPMLLIGICFLKLRSEKSENNTAAHNQEDAPDQNPVR